VINAKNLADVDHGTLAFSAYRAMQAVYDGWLQAFMTSTTGEFDQKEAFVQNTASKDDYVRAVKTAKEAGIVSMRRGS